MSHSRSPACAATAALVMAAALLAVAPGLVRAAQPSHAAKKAHTVIIEGLQYRPRIIVVRSGEPITWINRDLVPHTVTATGGSFDSHGIAPDGSWTYVPEKPGRYDYTCTFHPTMKGKLQVR